MNWIQDLIFGNGIGHSIMLLSICIVGGILLGKIKIKGISLGITFVLFIGIVCGHFGLTIDDNILHFMKEFGLILFVFSIGMQVGPGFFSSFRKGGVTLNLLAIAIVLLGVAATIVIFFVTDLPMDVMVGILSGAVTNTPGLGAAQTAFNDIYPGADNSIALGYAVAYPLGVIGIILAIVLIRYILRINIEKEQSGIEEQEALSQNHAVALSLEVCNPALFGNDIESVSKLLSHREFVISRLLHTDGKMEIV